MDTFELYLLGLVNIMDITDITDNIEEAGKRSDILNLLIGCVSEMVESHNGKLLQARVDNLLTYFPKTSDFRNAEPLFEALECFFGIIFSHSTRNERGLPELSYKVSAEYMNFPTYKSKQNSLCFDRVNPINSLEKMTKLAPSNRVIIVDDLCQILSRFPRNCSHYYFEEVQDINRSKKEPYYKFYLLSKDRKST